MKTEELSFKKIEKKWKIRSLTELDRVSITQ